MNRLIASLDGLQADPELRQMWLETQWLRQSFLAGKLALPRQWQLMIFKPPVALSGHKLVAAQARELAEALSACFAQKAEPADRRDG